MGMPEWECVWDWVVFTVKEWDPPGVTNRGLIVQQAECAGWPEPTLTRSRTKCFPLSHSVTGGRETAFTLYPSVPLNLKTSKIKSKLNKHRCWYLYFNMQLPTSVIGDRKNIIFEYIVMKTAKCIPVMWFSVISTAIFHRLCSKSHLSLLTSQAWSVISQL